MTRRTWTFGNYADFGELDCTVDLKSIKKSVYKNVPAKQKAPEFRELFVRAIEKLL